MIQSRIISKILLLFILLNISQQDDTKGKPNPLKQKENSLLAETKKQTKTQQPTPTTKSQTKKQDHNKKTVKKVDTKQKKDTPVTTKSSPPKKKTLETKNDHKGQLEDLFKSDEEGSDNGKESEKEFESMMQPFGFLTNFMKQMVSNFGDVDMMVSEDNPIFDLESMGKKTEIIKFDEEKSLNKNALIFHIPDDLDNTEYLWIQFKGKGNIQLDIIESKAKQETLFGLGEISLFNYGMNLHAPISLHYLKNYKGKYLRLKLNTMMFGIELKVTIKKVNSFLVEFDKNSRIYTKFTNELNFKVKVKKDKPLTKDSRIQFILKTGLKLEDIKGNEFLQMFINSNRTFSSDKTDYDMQASGNTGYGLIKTINSQSKFFCQEKDCVYNVKVLVQNLTDINFFPSRFANNSVINIKDYCHLVEELEVAEQVTYQISVPDNDHDWIFSIHPTENSPQVLINPDFKPKKLEKYKYFSKRDGPAQILITSQEQSKFKFNKKTFFVTFLSMEKSKVTSFSFEAQKVPKENRKYIKENYNVTGVVGDDEIVNFYLDLYSGEPDQYSLNIDLRSQSGLGDIFIKECSVIEDETCKITQEDVKNYETRKNNKPIIYKKIKAIKGENGHSDASTQLNFNCKGSDPLEEKNSFHNNDPTSFSCKFVFGIIGREALNTYHGIYYSFIVTGNNVIKVMQPNSSQNLQIMKNEILNYKIPINTTKHNDVHSIKLKVTSITGNCDILFSSQNKYPTEKRNEAKIQIQNDDITSLHTKIYRKNMKFKRNNNSVYSHIYLTIVGVDNCILEIYNEFVDTKMIQERRFSVEKLQAEKQVHRHLTDFLSFKKGESVTYYKEFLLEFPAEFLNQDFFEIHLNTEVLNVELCVQIDVDQLKTSDNCFYQSSTNNLKITKDDNFKFGKKFLIVVRKEVNNDELFVSFPIEFSLLVHSNATKKSVTYITPNRNFEYNLEGDSDLRFKVRMNEMRDKSMILLTTSSSFVQLEIRNEVDGEPIQTLSSYQFGLAIEDYFKFKKEFCMTKSCLLYLKLKNIAGSSAKASICVQLNKHPIRLKEGQQLFIPSNKIMYFSTHPKNGKPLSLTFQNFMVKSVLYANMVELSQLQGKQFRDFKYLINEDYFQYKTRIDEEGQIIYYFKNFNKLQAPVVLYMLIPKFNTKRKRTKSYSVYNQTDKTSVSLHSDILKLEPYSEQTGTVNEGDIRYFQINLSEPKDFTIFLNNQQGESVMYLNKGNKNLPTYNHHWMKSDGEGTQEIVVSKDKLKAIQGQSYGYSLILGVYGLENSQFTLLLVDEFKNVLKVTYQKVSNMQLKKGEMYYFDYYDDNEEFDSLLYTHDSDVEVTLLQYQEIFGQNFLNSIDSAFNEKQHFILKKNEAPRKRFNDNLFDMGHHFVIKVRALEKDTQFDFAIFDQKLPLIIPFKKEVNFAVNEGGSQIFEIYLNENYLEGDIRVKLKEGSINIAVSNVKDEYHDYQEIQTPSVRTFNFSDDKNKKKKNDLVIFKKLYIRVKASELSYFSIFVKPIDKFIELKPFQAKVINPEKDNDVYTYFTVDDKNIKKTHEFKIDIKSLTNFEQPEFLFISDDDIEINPNSAFLPMDIKTKQVDQLDGFKHYLITPVVQKGNYVIKFPQSYNNKPFKVQVMVNNLAQIPVNGQLDQSLEILSEEKYITFLPEEGEVRVILETCQNVSLKSLKMESRGGKKKKLKLVNNLQQAYPFIYENFKGSQKISEVQDINLQVQRYKISEEKLLHIEIENKEKVKGNFSLITEFRTKNQELILKDYIDYYSKPKKFSHVFFDSQTGNLKIFIKEPMFKEQLQSEFQSLREVKIKFTISMFYKENFLLQFINCGLTALAGLKEKPKVVTYEKIYSLNQLRNGDQLELVVGSGIMKEVAHHQQLMVAGGLEILFIENYEEQYQITVDPKFTEVPYFFITFDNQFYSMFWKNWRRFEKSELKNFIVLILIVGVIILCVIGKQCLSSFKRRISLDNLDVKGTKNHYIQNQYFEEVPQSEEKAIQNPRVEMVESDYENTKQGVRDGITI